MNWKIAPCIKKFFADADSRWPNRSRVSDGTVGDLAHQNRRSDHNPNPQGIVTAGDITHDPAHGVDCNELARQLVESRDQRIKYLIWNKRIWFPTANGAKPQGWSKYTGPNAHDHHLHISVKADLVNDLSPWPWSPQEGEKIEQGSNEANRPVLKLSSPMMHGEWVMVCQDKLVRLKLMNASEVDGFYGPDTERAMRLFQAKRQILIDGKVGPRTWAELDKAVAELVK